MKNYFSFQLNIRQVRTRMKVLLTSSRIIPPQINLLQLIYPLPMMWYKLPILVLTQSKVVWQFPNQHLALLNKMMHCNYWTNIQVLYLEVIQHQIVCLSIITIWTSLLKMYYLICQVTYKSSSLQLKLGLVQYLSLNKINR